MEDYFYLAIKMNFVTYYTWVNLKHVFIKRKKPNTKDYKIFYSTYMKLPEIANL